MELSSLQRGFVVAAVRALGVAAEGACLRRRLDQPVPSGLGRIHPSWYEAPSPSANGPARGWLERRAYAQLAPMDVAEPDKLELLDGTALEGLLERLGR